MEGSSIEEILEKGDKGEIRALFGFDSSFSKDEIVLLFQIWSAHFFPQYFKFEDAPFHEEIDINNQKTYSGIIDYFLLAGFRGCAKTTREKLWRAFVISNDLDHRKKYFKILTGDIGNAKQSVTDIYNILISPRIHFYYPEIFQKTTEKREETMASFTTSTGVKMRAGTVGTDQRGQLQEDARPDDIWFDDFETRKTLRSAVITKAIWDNMEEARTGLSKDGSATYTCNYVSERGNVHRLINKLKNNKRAAVMNIPIIEKGKPSWPQAYTVDQIEGIRKNADDFAGEYLGEPSAGYDIFFDRNCLKKQERKVPVRVVGEFKIFHAYDPSHRYAGAMDVAGGLGLDHSTSAFIDFSTTPSKVVATFKSNTIKPDTFGDEIKSQGDRFGGCLVAPENNNHGHATIGRLKQIYDNIYFTEQKETKVGIPPRSRTYGWNTNADSKPKALFALKKAVEDGHLELSDEDLINELNSYTRDDLMDKEEDPRLNTRHFDLLMAVAICYQLRNFAEVKKLVEQYEQPEYEAPTLND